MLFYLSLMVGVQNILYRQKVDIKILTDMLYDLRILKTMNLYPVYSILIQYQYLQPIITQYFIDNKSEIWLLFLIAHSKR